MLRELLLMTIDDDRCESILLYLIPCNLQYYSAHQKIIIFTRSISETSAPLLKCIKVMLERKSRLYSNFHCMNLTLRILNISVMSCDWAPTGREFVSGSYDRTVRLWKGGEGKARDTYHTKRMQRFVLP
jgi:WD40 repeat protein